MNLRREIEEIRIARLDVIFENLNQLPNEAIDELASSVEHQIVGRGSIELAKGYLRQHPAICTIEEYARNSTHDLAGRDLHLVFYEGSYLVRSVDLQIKSGARRMNIFRDNVRGYLKRHGAANPTEEDIDKDLARRRLLVLNPRSGYKKFMASFDKQMELVCNVAGHEK